MRSAFIFLLTHGACWVSLTHPLSANPDKAVGPQDGNFMPHPAATNPRTKTICIQTPQGEIIAQVPTTDSASQSKTPTTEQAKEESSSALQYNPSDPQKSSTKLVYAKFDLSPPTSRTPPRGKENTIYTKIAPLKTEELAKQKQGAGQTPPPRPTAPKPGEGKQETNKPFDTNDIKSPSSPLETHVKLYGLTNKPKDPKKTAAQTEQYSQYKQYLEKQNEARRKEQDQWERSHPHDSLSSLESTHVLLTFSTTLNQDARPQSDEQNKTTGGGHLSPRKAVRNAFAPQSDQNPQPSVHSGSGNSHLDEGEPSSPQTPSPKPKKQWTGSPITFFRSQSLRTKSRTDDKTPLLYEKTEA